MEDQRSAFITREPSRKTNGERVRIEQSSHRDDLARVYSIFGPSGSGTFAGKREKFTLQEQMYVPEFFVRDIHDTIPERNVIVLVDPLWTEVTVEEQPEFRSNPSRGMNPVRNGSNRNIVFRHARPNDLPHSSRNAAVEMAHTVTPSSHSKCENRHVERVAKLAEIDKLLPCNTEFVPVPRKVFLHHV